MCHVKLAASVYETDNCSGFTHECFSVFFNHFNTKRLFLIKLFKICLFIPLGRLLAMFRDNHLLWLRDITSYGAWDCNFLAKCFLENVFDLELKRHLVSELFRYIWIPRVKQSKRSRWTPFWERDLKAVPNERHCLLNCGFVCRTCKLAVSSHEENEKRFHCKFGRGMGAFSQLFSLLAKQTLATQAKRHKIYITL